MDERIGTQLAGYRIEALIGRGGMGVVYRAEHVHLRRTVALKLLAPELAWSEGFRERFIHESRIAAGIQHPNIVTIYDAGEADELLYIAMHYVEGTDLSRLLRSERQLEPERALWILEQIGSALDAAHSRGLVHRDVKPANVLIDTDRAYLSDFGLTKRTKGSTALTSTGQFVGTLDYVAPEQIDGRPLDARTDVYALGCLLYECLTGDVPFQRDSEIAVLYAHLNDTPPPPSAARADLPPALDDVVTTALAKNPDDRYQSCGDLVSAMASVRVDGRPTEAAATRRIGDVTRPPESIETARMTAPEGWPRRRRLAVAALGLLVVIGAGAALVAALSGGDDEPVRRAERPRAESGPPPPLPADPVRRQTTRVGGRPFGIAAGAGGIWVTSFHDGTVTRLDPSTGRVTGPPIQSGAGPYGVVAGRSSVWVTNFRAETLVRVDASSRRRVGAPVQVQRAPTFVSVAADGSVWVSNSDDDTVTQVGASGSAAPVHRRVGHDPQGVATAGSRAWVANASDGTVSRLDAGRGRVRTFEVGEQPHGIAIRGGVVWVTNLGDDTVSRIDARTGRARGRAIEVGDAPWALALDERHAWVTNSGDNTVTRIERRSGRQVGRPIRVGRQPSGIAVGGGSVWVANNDSHTVTRIRP